ncbi:MAG: SNF2-related protein, partial [Pirellula sp.]
MCLAVSPFQSLVIEEIAAEWETNTPLKVELQAAITKSTSHGLELLAAEHTDSLPLTIKYFKDFASSYFRSLCRSASQDVKRWVSPPAPSEEDRLQRIESAPPLMGIEHLNSELLLKWWQDLDAHTESEVRQSKADLSSFLKKLNPNWNLIGRVTFHLAENKKSTDHPFAFLATFTEGTSDSGNTRHVPLSEALKSSISAKDTYKLNILLEPVQRAAAQSKFLGELLDSRKIFSPQAWTIKQAYQFLQEVSLMEQSGVVVRVPNWWSSSRPPRPQVQVRIGDKQKKTLGLVEALDFQIDVAFDGIPLTADEQEQLLAAREGMTLLRGKWVEVDANRLKQAMDQWNQLRKQNVQGVDFLQGLRLLSGASIGSEVVDETTRNWSRVEAGPWLKKLLDDLRNPNGLMNVDPNVNIRATLRHYQVDGVRWLWLVTQMGLGACLADDMGLGKTIQIISLLQQRKLFFSDNGNENRMTDRRPPSLLIAPTSLLGNWKREIERFAPDLRLFIAHRSHTDNSLLSRATQNPMEVLSEYDLVATTYGLARRDSWLTQRPWDLLVLDEAQAIKNANATQTKSIKRIEAAGRIALTGTPVENHLGDLWSLFDFCSPGLLGSASQFQSFAKNSGENGMASLRRLVRPYILRRLKTDPNVAPDLPAKTEMRVDCGLSAVQATLYKKIVDELEEALDTATGIQRRGLVLSVMMQLKQICNHPALYLKNASFAPKNSGKFDELRTICETIIERQERVLVFTQFQSMCGPLDAFL